MTVLVTGAAGYIGSHAVQALLRKGERVVAVDNLSRGHRAALDALNAPAGKLTFLQGDVGNRAWIEAVLRGHHVTSVLHFAALAYVGESVDHALRYYRNNVGAMISLLDACDAVGVKRFVFSSSCATYGQPDELFIPITEACPQDPVSPYGRTKLVGEWMLRDHAESCRRAARPFAFAALRYFNVAGCDTTGVLGEDHDPETHLVPVVIMAAQGRREGVEIFGTDYPTPDGTCIRDYVHVEDLAEAHVAVLDSLQPGDARAYNLGIGKGSSVREVIESVKRISGRDFKVVERPRRAGDPARLFADPSLVQRELGWGARLTELDEIVASAWRWFEAHPKGYAE